MRCHSYCHFTVRKGSVREVMQFPPNHTAGQCQSWELHTHVSASRVQTIIHHRVPSQLAGASPISILGGAE